MKNFKVGQIIQGKMFKDCFLVLKIIKAKKRIYGVRMETMQLDTNTLYIIYEASFCLFKVIA